MKEILPQVKECNASVIVIPSDDKGIPYDAEQRLSVAYKIVEQAEILGIPRADVIIDCLAMTLGSDTGAGSVTLIVNEFVELHEHKIIFISNTGIVIVL